MLDLLEQGRLGFRQRQPKALWAQGVTFQLGDFLYHFGFAGLRLDNDLYLQSHRKALLRVRPSLVALGVLPKPPVHRPPVEAIQEKPLLPRLQLLLAPGLKCSPFISGRFSGDDILA
jgi:hypothetical protein